MLCSSLPIYLGLKFFALIGVGSTIAILFLMVMFKVVGER